SPGRDPAHRESRTVTDLTPDAAVPLVEPERRPVEAGHKEQQAMTHVEETAPGQVTRADIDQLDEALEIANRVLRAASRQPEGGSAVSTRSLAALTAGRRSAAAGSFSVLQAAQAELG